MPFAPSALACALYLAPVLAWLALRIVPHVLESPWLALTAFMVGFVAADFVSGFIHWAAGACEAMRTRITAEPRTRTRVVMAT